MTAERAPLSDELRVERARVRRIVGWLEDRALRHLARGWELDDLDARAASVVLEVLLRSQLTLERAEATIATVVELQSAVEVINGTVTWIEAFYAVQVAAQHVGRHCVARADVGGPLVVAAIVGAAVGRGIDPDEARRIVVEGLERGLQARRAARASSRDRPTR